MRDFDEREIQEEKKSFEDKWVYPLLQYVLKHFSESLFVLGALLLVITEIFPSTTAERVFYKIVFLITLFAILRLYNAIVNNTAFLVKLSKKIGYLELSLKKSLNSFTASSKTMAESNKKLKSSIDAQSRKTAQKRY